MRICHICETECEDKGSCPKCTVDIPARQDPATMTAEERVTEIEQLYGVLEVDFAILHTRISALCGRPVWTHEMANHEHIAGLARARNCAPPTADELVSRFPAGKPVIAVVAPDPERPS